MENLTEIVNIHEIAAILRDELRPYAADIKDLMHNENNREGADIGETKANIMLAYRHLEDCLMRLGKVIQAQGAALDGGANQK